MAYFSFVVAEVVFGPHGGASVKQRGCRSPLAAQMCTKKHIQNSKASAAAAAAARTSRTTPITCFIRTRLQTPTPDLYVSIHYQQEHKS